MRAQHYIQRGPGSGPPGAAAEDATGDGGSRAVAGSPVVRQRNAVGIDRAQTLETARRFRRLGGAAARERSDARQRRRGLSREGLLGGREGSGQGSLPGA